MPVDSAASTATVSHALSIVVTQLFSLSDATCNTVAGTYVAIAYYDDLFDCDDKLRSLGGLYGALTAPLKPAVGADGRYGGDALPAATTSPADCD